MNDYLLYGIIALVVIIILAFIFLKVIKNKQPKQIIFNKLKPKRNIGNIMSP